MPISYSGKVGCPDCSFKFAVEASVAPSAPPEDEEDDDVELHEPVEEKQPSKIEVGCPECGQTLRIPSSYDGSVRCPACTQVFKSHEGIREA